MKTSPLWKQVQTLLSLTADGIPGKATLQGVCSHLGLGTVSHPEPGWKPVQERLKVTADGIPGDQTARAVLLNLISKMNDPGTIVWPGESEVPKYFGKPGEGLQMIDLPYPMRLAWDKRSIVKKTTCHSLVALPLKRIFTRTLEHYGSSRLSELGLDLFGGCFNNRSKVGGTSKSMHAYGIAIDLDPDRNQLKWDRRKAVFAKPEYDAFWNIVEAENAVSLGRCKNYDWMHFQFARPN